MTQNTQRQTLTVLEKGIRLDRFVASHCPDYSRTFLQKLIDEGYITVNSRLAKSGHKLENGDKVDIIIPAVVPGSLSPEAIPLQIIYEDDDILVVNKPPGLTTHPAPGQKEHTLVNAILAYYPRLAELGETLRPGVVHRLDKDTSGLIIIAKNTKAQLNLVGQFKERSVKKVYLTLVKGHLIPEQGIIEAPVGRHPNDRTRMAVVNSGRPARSVYKVIEYIEGYTLLEVRPETGRTHQIRVHLSAIGFPVAGDAAYGERSPVIRRQFLHAHRLSFKQPSTGETIELKSELPEDLKLALRDIEKLK